MDRCVFLENLINFRYNKLTQKELWFDQDTVIYSDPTKLSYRFKSHE